VVLLQQHVPNIKRHWEIRMFVMNDIKELKELNKHYLGGRLFNIEKNQCLIFLDCNVGINFILNTFFYYRVQLWCYRFVNFNHVWCAIWCNTYGSKINWLHVFANHKGTTCMLNVLVLIFDSFHSKKICDFINLFLW
jgi:hypothetical protein